MLAREVQSDAATFLSPMSSEKIEQVRWFEEEVHPHAADLRNYLRRSFPGVRDVDDVVQESFLRVWVARAGQPIRSARAFLFTVGRRLAIDLVRREQASPMETRADLEVLAEQVRGDDLVVELHTKEKISFLAEAVADLPSRCREIVILRKLQGIPQREVARRLGLSEKTVEVQVARGVRRCEEYLRARGVGEGVRHE